jgi:HSP20 family protein
MEDLKMAIMRYEPATAISQLQQEINRLFGSHSDTDSSGATADWMPAVDIHEYADRFELLVDLPGVDPTGVQITLDNGILTLSGERHEKAHSEASDRNGPQKQRSERRLGTFFRRFILPDTVDSEKVKATGSNGVLEISIAKQPKAQPRRISVNS